MYTMGRGGSFRTQLFFREQRELYDYWLTLKGDRTMPLRAQVSPADISHLLPNVCIVELLEPPRHARFRLAGTALRDIYGREVTGSSLDDPAWGETQSYWARIYDMLREDPQPASGMLSTPGDGRDHLVLFWMRLPLAGHEGDARPLALGLDMAIAASRVQEEVPLAAGGDGLLSG